MNTAANTMRKAKNGPAAGERPKGWQERRETVRTAAAGVCILLGLLCILGAAGAAENDTAAWWTWLTGPVLWAVGLYIGREK